MKKKKKPNDGRALPELLAEIAEVAGLPAALALAAAKGGTRAHIPAKAANDHWLVMTVGRLAADKLCEHFRVNHTGGVSILMPMGPTNFYAFARQRALALRAKGVSIAETARTVGVTTRAVEKWSADHRRSAKPAARPPFLGLRPSMTEQFEHPLTAEPNQTPDTAPDPSATGRLKMP